MLAAFDLTRRSAFADEPAFVDLRVEMTIGEIAANETFTSDGGAVVAEVFERVAFDVVTEEQVNEGAGGGVFGGDFRCK